MSPGPLPARLARSQVEPWQTRLLQRMRHLWWLKFLGVCGFMWLFFIGYFHTLRNPRHEVVLMPLTWLDDVVVFQPGALWVYVSLWLYVGVAPGLLATFRELVAYALWIGALCVLGLTCFHFWPTAVPKLSMDLSIYPGFALVHGVDAAGNACPSLHVATAAFTAMCRACAAVDRHATVAADVQCAVGRGHRLVDDGHQAARGLGCGRRSVAGVGLRRTLVMGRAPSCVQALALDPRRYHLQPVLRGWFVAR